MVSVVGQQFPNALVATIELFRQARIRTMEAAAALNHVVEEELWKTSYNSFSDFVEEGLLISKGHASKLLSVYKHYVIEGGVAQATLEDVDADKLYLAMKLMEPAEKKVEIARVLSRRELKETHNDQAPHEHILIQICSVCRMRVDNATN